MKAQGIPDLQAPPPVPKFIDAAEPTGLPSSPQDDELPSYDSFEPPVVSNVEPEPDDF